VELSYEKRKVKRREIVRVQSKSSVGIDTDIDTIDIYNTWLILSSIDTGIDTLGMEAEPAANQYKSNKTYNALILCLT
jgi:hypothetical protein